MRITVLMGADSPEREISLCSGESVAHALAAEHEVTTCDILGGLPPLSLLRASDAVFLALHGGAGEDGRVQHTLEKAGIFHYSGSRALACARAMRKDRAKSILRMSGVRVARGYRLAPGRPPRFVAPCVFKPLAGGSSIGLSVVREAWQMPQCFDRPMLCEEFLPGREYSIGVLAGRALPVVEICPREGEIYDYQHKYTAGAMREECPARISPEKERALCQMALRAFAALGLRDYARIDIKENADGEPIFLEANALPGMTPQSLFPLAARAAGISFSTLCRSIAQMANERKKER